MKVIKNIILVSILCTSFSTFAQSKKSVYFYEIDDQASIYVNGEKVYESDVVQYVAGLEVEVDLTEYIITNEEEITVKLFNAECACESENPWSVIFEIRDADVGMDYHYDEGEGDAGEIAVYSYTFTWEDLY